MAAAFVRGKLAVPHGLTDTDVIAFGRAQGLRLHKFKRHSELPRVRKVLGVLRGLAPRTLLDLGSGRGTFLWPLIDAFPDIEVTATDRNPLRVDDIDAVRRGGVESLRARVMDATAIELADSAVDVVTALEVLEHLERPLAAAQEAVRVAARFVVASVPSKEDDNPEHIHLFDRDSFERLWLAAGASGVRVEYVLNHMIAVARI